MKYVVCLTCFTIASTGPHHTVDIEQKRIIDREWCNAVGGFIGGDVFVFGVFGGVGVALMGFEVDGAQKLG